MVMVLNCCFLVVFVFWVMVIFEIVGMVIVIVSVIGESLLVSVLDMLVLVFMV